jgi:hypothetical protein
MARDVQVARPRIGRRQAVQIGVTARVLGRLLDRHARGNQSQQVVEHIGGAPGAPLLDPFPGGGDGLGRLLSIVLLRECPVQAGHPQLGRHALPAARVGEHVADGGAAEQGQLGEPVELGVLTDHRGHHRGVRSHRRKHEDRGEPHGIPGGWSPHLPGRCGRVHGGELRRGRPIGSGLVQSGSFRFV